MNYERLYTIMGKLNSLSAAIKKVREAYTTDVIFDDGGRNVDLQNYLEALEKSIKNICDSLYSSYGESMQKIANEMSS